MGYGSYRITKPNQTPNSKTFILADRQWEISSIVERERALIVS